MENRYIQTTRELIDFIRRSPTAFQAVESISAELDANGYTRLSESGEWKLNAGGRYYITRNLSSVVAFELPESLGSFMIAASHTDSPAFKLKNDYESAAFNTYLRLNTERYGGMIYSCWLDRPLSVAGRVTVERDGKFSSKPVSIDRNLCLIPNVAMHFNRTLNDGYKYNPAVDLMPLYSDISGKGSLKKLIAEAAGAAPEEIVGMDMFLCDRTPGCIWGADDEFYSSPRIDNLACAYGTLRGMLESDVNKSAAKIYACFDNEETGSLSKQGAESALLRDTLERICEFYGADIRRVMASSFMVSADNGHAKHPNHPELSDDANSPKLNGGVAIKFNASQKYATDGVSYAIFSDMCRRAGVPFQHYANRSDLPGGSTLGSIANASVPVCTVDIGLAQLAMHSCYETAGTADERHLIDVMKYYYSHALASDGDGAFEIK